MLFLIKSKISGWICKFFVDIYGRGSMKYHKRNDVKDMKLKIIIFLIV